MQCAQHPAAAATAVCSRCDRPICPQCRQERSGKAFCTSCAEHLDRRAQAAPRPVVARPTPPLPVPPLPPPPVAEPAATAPGDLYEGPPIGDVYTGPPPVEGPPTEGPPPPPAETVYNPEAAKAKVPSANPAAAQHEGNMPRMLLYAGIAGLVCGGAWYGIAVASGYKVGWVAIGIGWLVGMAAVAGAGGGGPVVALVALLTTGGAIGFGDYLIARDAYQELRDQEAAEWAKSAKYLDDGRLSDAELREYYEMDADEFSAMAPDEIAEARQEATEQLRHAATATEPSISFNALWLAMFGVKDVLFYVIGLLNAGRLALGKT